MMKFIFEIVTETVLADSPFDLVTPKSMGFLCCPSLRGVGQGVLELLIGNEKVTDGQTGRPTCTKPYALSSSKGGIIKKIDFFTFPD